MLTKSISKTPIFSQDLLTNIKANYFLNGHENMDFDYLLIFLQIFFGIITFK